MRFSLLAAAAFAASVTASPSSNHVLHERRDKALRYWTKGSAVPAKAVLPFRIGLVQSNLDKGHEMLMETSEMSSPKYGQHYTAEEVIEIFAPPQHAVDSVRSWLESAGIAADRISQSVNKQWIQLDASVQEAERLFKTKYHHYTHSGSGNSNIGCDEYHLPEHVGSVVDYVTPGIKMMAGSATPELRKRNMEDAMLTKRGFRTSARVPFSGPAIIQPLGSGLQRTLLADGSNSQLAHCDIAATPPCIAALYNITKATKAAKGNELGIFEEGDFYSASDLDEFWQNFSPNIPTGTRPKLEGIDGGTAPSPTAGGESNLDLEASWPIIYPQKEVLFQTDDIYYALGIEGSGGFLNTFFDAIDGSYCTYKGGDSPLDPVYPDPNPQGYQGKTQCGVYKPTNVISISYGEQEDDLPVKYQTRQCSEVMKLAMQGVTVVVSSGDSGVGARGEDGADVNGCQGSTGKIFNPDFPTSCPYIVSAGASFLALGGKAGVTTERAVDRFPSGGGFSNIYPRPSYQDKAVKTYLNKYVPPYKSYALTSPVNNVTDAQAKGGIYNRAGRGYPDIAAIGDNVVITLNGAYVLIGGTSASAPVIAGMFNRINEERLAKGRSTIGFVHPTIYSNPQAFRDVTVGSNPGCDTQGFTCSPGWDPVTGLGTIDYPKLLAAFMQY